MKKYKFILSGYTRRSNRGVHILELSVNEEVDSYRVEENSFKLLDLDNPSYICLSQDKFFALTSRNQGSVLAYKYDKSSDRLDKIDGVSGLGKSPCHLYFDEEQSFIYASNYHLGRLDIITLEADSLDIYKSIMLEGKGPISPNQDGPRCHMAVKDPNGSNVLLVNLGGDRVDTYRIGRQKEPRLVSTYHTKAGMGPRHLVFSHDSRYVYLMGELDSTVEVLAYDSSEGSLSLVDRLSSLPKETEEILNNSGAAIKITKTKNIHGSYNLYVSNRGHNSLSVYDVDDYGHIKMIQNIETCGKTPRDFCLTSDDKFILVGHQDSDDIVLFARSDSGSLSLCKRLDSNLDEIVCLQEIE